MKKWVNIKTPPMKKARIEIIPMIDTIFFLLVFFMFTSLSMVKMKGMDVSLPKDSTSTEAPPPQVVITVNQAGQYYLNTDSINGDALVTELQTVWMPSRTPCSSSTSIRRARPRTLSPSWTPSTTFTFPASPPIPWA